MTRCVYESHFVATFSFDGESPDALSDEPKFLFGDRVLVVSISIQKSGLAMVYMTHYSHDRSPSSIRLHLLFLNLNEFNLLLQFDANEFDSFVAQDLEFIRDDLICLFMQDLEQFQWLLIQQFCQLPGIDIWGNTNHGFLSRQEDR